ncbi:hypothetical protein [Flectobacillus sp. BAB-3569]|uniref:hypothetical protein n=1 Tax=Flectobacillus sp. BAB-3569 TaxID=1509483 RepID=UPI000BA38DA4|nr:hypothetical protein [Flectobacillus sp. BAB-3569]PAC27817.1 hypothetical protein BWI92_21635 [Flectobacillus sp. BAB-3569]
MKKLAPIPKLSKQQEDTQPDEKFTYSKEDEKWTFIIDGEHADKIKRIMYHNHFKTKTEVLHYILAKYLDPLDLPPVPKRKDF